VAGRPDQYAAPEAIGRRGARRRGQARAGSRWPPAGAPSDGRWPVTSARGRRRLLFAVKGVPGSLVGGQGNRALW